MMKRLLLATVLLVLGCDGGATPAATTAATAGETPSACLAAFQVAAGVDATADSAADLYPAVVACGSLAEWTAGYEAVDGAGFNGSAMEVLSNVCFASEVIAEPLCAESGPGESTENVLEERGPGLTIVAGDSGAANLKGGPYRIAWVADGCTKFTFEWAPTSGDPVEIEPGILSGHQVVDLPAGPGTLNRVADCDYTIRFEAVE